MECVETARVSAGLVIVASRHTTASIVVNEHEPELLKDLDVFLAHLAPTEGAYAHNEVPCLPGEGPNAHAHCQALLLGASISLPIVDGKLVLGRWQRIFLVELDCARPREVTVALLGS
jgi:secondary thiamine-phosphate synthase enzyme